MLSRRLLIPGLEMKPSPDTPTTLRLSPIASSIAICVDDMVITRAASPSITCPSKPSGTGSPSRDIKRLTTTLSAPCHGFDTVRSVLHFPSAPLILNPRAYTGVYTSETNSLIFSCLLPQATIIRARNNMTEQDLISFS